MKFISAGCLLLVVLFLFCLCSAFFVDRVVSETDDLLVQAMTHEEAGRKAEAARLITDAMEVWEKNHGPFGILLRHDEAEEVLVELSRLQSYSISIDQDDFSSNCAALRITLHHIQDMAWPHYYNLL